MRWRFLKDEPARIPYTEIAEHAAAIFFPGAEKPDVTVPLTLYIQNWY